MAKHKLTKHQWRRSSVNSSLWECAKCEWRTSDDKEDGPPPEGPCFGSPNPTPAQLVEMLLPEHAGQAFHYSLIYREELKRIDARIAQLHSELRDLTLKKLVIDGINQAANRTYERIRRKRPYDDF